ncbi:MAG: hypothetical protein IT204_12165 [Fimbriimonadaceae bacterium]|nr:hypothetical protein [Fimbriimonadaceae bacterium]
MTCCVAFALLAGQVAAAAEPIVDYQLTVDRGEDRGQNFGSLFEVTSTDGKLTIGAGFAGVYNTYLRPDRHVLQCYVRDDSAPALQRQALPRAGGLAGAYLFDLDGALHATVEDVRRYDGAQWVKQPTTHGGRIRIGAQLVLFDNNSIVHDQQTILGAPPQGSYVRFYYAQGCWFYYHVHRGPGGYRAYQSDDDGFSKLCVSPWRPGDGPLDPAQAKAFTLPVVGEVPFAWGQLGGEVLTCSNIGGLYAYDGRQWRTLRQPDLKVSYQVYSMLNYHDRLLLGQYPSGRLFEYDGRTVRELAAAPPVMPGVSGASREAQTTTIYGGRLYVGVWPWGELWRQDQPGAPWELAARLFDEPAPTDATTHPYENECRAAGLVLNQYGQRVTSLLPHGADLVASTSAKDPCRYDPKLLVLGDDKWQAYGQIYRLTAPGNLSAPLTWTAGPTALRLSIDTTGLRMEQDGRLLGHSPLPAALLTRLRQATWQPVRWQQGVFGTFGGLQVAARQP